MIVLLMSREYSTKIIFSNAFYSPVVSDEASNNGLCMVPHSCASYDYIPMPKMLALGDVMKGGPAIHQASPGPNQALIRHHICQHGDLGFPSLQNYDKYI